MPGRRREQRRGGARRMGRRACGTPAQAPAPPRWRPAALCTRWQRARTAPHTCAVAPRPSAVLASARRERQRQPGPHAALHVEHSACDARTVRGLLTSLLCARLRLESNACWRVDHRLHCRWLACSCAHVHASGPSPTCHCVHEEPFGTWKPSGITLQNRRVCSAHLCCPAHTTPVSARLRHRERARRQAAHGGRSLR